MFTYSANDVLQSLVIDSGYYESQEMWEEMNNVKNLFDWVMKNAVDGLVYLSPEQRDVYLCGECWEVDGL